MVSEIVYLIISLLVSGITWYLYAAVRSSGLHDRRMTGFDALCVTVPFWIVLDAITYIAAPGLFPALFVLKAFPLNLIPYISCRFFLYFSESKIAGSRFIRYFTVGMPAVAVVLLLTNPWHHMYYVSFGNPPEVGPAFLAHLAVSIVYILIVYATLFRYVVKNYRSNPLLIVGGAGAVVPAIIYIAYLFLPGTLPYDFTAMGYFFTIVFVTYASYHSRLRSVKPGILGDTLARLANSREISEGRVEDAARLISKEAGAALGAYRARVWDYDSKSLTLKCVACYNNQTGGYTAREDYSMQGMAEFVEYLMSERVIAVSDTGEAMGDTGNPYDPEVCAALLAPVRIGHEPVGVVCVEQNFCRDFPTKREWSPEEQSFVSSLADLMVLTIANNERQSLIRRLEEEQAALRESIEEERAAAAKLIETEEARRNLQVILDMLPVGIRILSVDDLTLLYSNKACLDIFGCTSFEEQVKHQSGYTFMPEFQPDGRRTADVVNEIFERGDPVAEIQCLRLDGEPFLCRVTTCTIDYGGRPASLAAMEDITEERNRRQMLETIASKEQEANQLKSRFLATMSHEIRTPMNAVIGMTEIALREDSPEAKNEHIRTVRQAASTLLAIVNDILDFSKIEAGKLEIVPRDYSIASMLNDVISIVKTRIDGLRIRLAIKVDSKIPRTLFGDETKVNQAVLNILSNAVKFTEEGYITFGVYADFAGKNTVNLIFEITDTGIGIKQEDLDRLFTGFIQFDLEKNRDTEGTGLGLAITHSIVKAMGGDISVRSEYGRGSTFTIKIPQKYRLRDALARVDRPGEKSVLVYDRRNAYSESIVYTLENLGAQCSHVSDKAEFASEIGRRAYDYLFIPAALLEESKDAVKEFGEKTKIVILAGSGTAGPERRNTLAMGAYCIHVADILSGADNSLSNAADADAAVKFTAPGARVLIVDDIRTNLAVAQGLLAPYGMQVDTCTGGKEAIDAAVSAEYDLIFMDHKMPGMDGVETTRRIREMGIASPAGGEVPIIALTANAVSSVMEMFMENGFNDFLSKPIDMAKLGGILEKWVPKGKQQAK